MKRAELKRKVPIARSATTSDSKKRLRKCAVKECRKPFEPRSMTHKCCSPECAQVYAEAERKRKERKDRQEGLAKLQTRSDHMKAAQREFNAYIRARDAGLPCICCGKFAGEAGRGGAVDAGHYRSVGSAPFQRFNENNCHLQNKQCNRFGAGRAVDYRIGLIKKIGLAAVEALESDNTPRKWTIEELIQIKEHYRQKLKQLKEGK